MIVQIAVYDCFWFELGELTSTEPLTLNNDVQFAHMEESNRLSFVIPVIIVLFLFFSNLFCDNMFPQLSGSNHIFSVLFLKPRQNAFDELQLNTKKYTECLFCVTKYNSNNPFIQFISKFPCWWDSWFVDKFLSNEIIMIILIVVCVFVCETFFLWFSFPQTYKLSNKLMT